MYFHFCPVCVNSYKMTSSEKVNHSETVVVMLLGLIAQILQLAGLRLGFLLAFSFSYFIVELHNQMRYSMFPGSLI